MIFIFFKHTNFNEANRIIKKQAWANRVSLVTLLLCTINILKYNIKK